MKYTAIKDGKILAVVAGDVAALRDVYAGCTLFDGEFPADKFSFVDGQFIEKPQVIFEVGTKKPSRDELAAAATNSALQRRSAMLAASDWTQLPDVPLTTKNLWAAYRQGLRDITRQPEYPHSIKWPVPPR